MNPALIQAFITGAITLVDLIQRVRYEAVRTGVMTPEQDKAFDLQMQNAFSAPHWQKSDKIDP